MESKEKVNLKDYKLVESIIPKIGDLVFMPKDHREEDAFRIARVVLDKSVLIINESQKVKYSLYRVIGVNNENEFRKFEFWDGQCNSSRKMKANSKVVRDIINEFKIN